AEHDDLGVDVRARVSEGLDVELIKLPETAALRLLVPEHRPRAPHPLTLVVQQAVRDHGAHHAGGPLRPQGQRVPARILEREHLLLHDVRELSDRTLEQRRVLHDRHADLPIGVRGEQLPGEALEAMPGGDLRRQDVIHAARRLNLLLSHSMGTPPPSTCTAGAKPRAPKLSSSCDANHHHPAARASNTTSIARGSLSEGSSRLWRTSDAARTGTGTSGVSPSAS